MRGSKRYKGYTDKFSNINKCVRFVAYNVNAPAVKISPDGRLFQKEFFLPTICLEAIVPPLSSTC